MVEVEREVVVVGVEGVGVVGRLATVEVAVAAASGASEGGGVGGGGGGGGHELAAAVKGVAAEAGGVVLEAFLVGEGDSRRSCRRGRKL